MMDQSKIYENLPVGLLFAILIMIQVVPEPFKPFLLYGGMFGCIGMMVAIEYGFKIKASEYLYILLILRPSGAKMNLFIKRPRQGVRSRCYDQETGMYETTVELGEKADHPHFKTIREVVFKHQFPWENRMMFLPGKAIFRGYPIEHNATAIITAYEPETSKAQVEHLDPILVCTINDAPNDWYIMHGEPTPFEETHNQLAANGGMATVEATANNNASIKQRIDKAISEAKDWKRRCFDEHQLRIRLEGEVEELRNEFHGLTGRGGQVGKLKFEEVQTLLFGHNDIHSAYKEIAPRMWPKISKWAAILVIGALSVYFFSTNGDLRLWISSNQLLIIIIAIVSVVIFYYLNQRRKG